MSDWFEGASGQAVDVAALVDGTGVVEVIAAIVAAGALVSLGTTSDGGALAVTVTVDGRWRREYFREPEQLNAFLFEAKAAVEGAAQSRPASSGSRRRNRRP